MEECPQAAEAAYGPLAGVRVLDLTTVVMGPFATQILGDLGADVIKIEQPSGDSMRRVGPFRHHGMGPMYLQANRNKRSVVLDLKSERDRDVLLDLAQETDVFVSNVRPQAMARLGLGYETLAARNPEIIYCGAVGYGSDGPNAGKAVYDDLTQAGAGIAGLFASVDGAPRYAPVNICDRVVGLYLAIAIVSALHHRARTGEGQQIEVPMLETMAQFVLADHMGGGAFVSAHRPHGVQAPALTHARPLSDARRLPRDCCLYRQALARVFRACRQAGPARHRSALPQPGDTHAACRGDGPVSRRASAA